MIHVHRMKWEWWQRDNNIVDLMTKSSSSLNARIWMYAWCSNSFSRPCGICKITQCTHISETEKTTYLTFYLLCCYDRNRLYIEWDTQREDEKKTHTQHSFIFSSNRHCCCCYYFRILFYFLSILIKKNMLKISKQRKNMALWKTNERFACVNWADEKTTAIINILNWKDWKRD